MRRLALFAVLALAACASPQTSPTQGDWTQLHGGATHDNSGGDKLKIDNPEVAWHVEGAVGQPTISGDDLYTGGKALMRIHAETGEVLARIDAPMRGDEPEFYYVPAPLITESSVIARRSSGLVAHSRDLKTALWEMEVPGARKANWGFPATLFEGTVLFGIGTDLVAVDAESGELDWQLSMGSEINMVPVADDGQVFVGAANGRFVAINIEEGTETWNYDGEGQFGHTSPVLAGGKIIVGDRGVSGGRRGAILALDAETGERVWETEFGATGLSTPGVHKDIVFAGFGKYVGFFDLDDGSRRTSPQIRCGANAFGSPTVLGKHLVYGHLDGNLYVHSMKSGKLEWQFRVPDAQVSDFVYANKHLFVSTTVGLVALKDGKGKMKGNVKTWSPGTAAQ